MSSRTNRAIEAELVHLPSDRNTIKLILHGFDINIGLAFSYFLHVRHVRVFLALKYRIDLFECLALGFNPV